MYLVETGPKPEPSPASPAVPSGQDYSSFTYVLGYVLSKNFKYLF